MKRVIAARSPPPKRIPELKEVVEEEWKINGLKHVQNLAHMPRRAKLVRQSKARFGH